MENMATLLHFFGGSQGEPWWYFMKKNQHRPDLPGDFTKAMEAIYRW